MKDIRLVVLSGPSGSGKSTAIKALEDLGFYCMDNIPVTLLPKFLEILADSPDINKVATVVDVREGEFLKSFTPVFSELKENCCRVELLYLEASDESLVSRFSETRRRHPLAASESPLEGIGKERELLRHLKERADKVIDTTKYNVHDLRLAIMEHFSGPVSREKMAVNLISFGYKYGIPADADLVVDIRFLPNPYFMESMRGLDGRAELVREFIMSKPETQEFLVKFKGFIDYLIPLYWKEGKSYLTIGVGCTGGKHRSVVVTDELVKSLGSDIITIRKKDRDIQKH